MLDNETKAALADIMALVTLTGLLFLVMVIAYSFDPAAPAL